jgi:hypothetical protein
LRRLLLSADLFNEDAIRFGSRNVKTPLSRVSASLCSVTWRDQRRPRPFDAVAFLAMTSPRLGAPRTIHRNAPVRRPVPASAPEPEVRTHIAASAFANFGFKGALES